MFLLPTLSVAGGQQKTPCPPYMILEPRIKALQAN